MKQKALIDLSDEELEEALRRKAENVLYSYADYRAEAYRRAQNKLAKAMNWLTLIMALATIAQVVIAIVK